MKNSIPGVLALLAAGAMPSQAALIARYAFTGNYTNTAPAITGLSAASDVTFGAGLTEIPTGTGISSSPGNTLFVRSSVVNQTSVATAIGADDYFSFQLTIAPGYQLDLNSVSFQHWTGTATPTTFYTSSLAVYYTLGSTDFSSEAAAVKVGEHITDVKTVTDVAFTETLLGNEALTGTVTFHFVFWDPASTNLDNRVSRLDAFAIDGTFSAVPEPSPLVLSGALLLAPLFLRRRF